MKALKVTLHQQRNGDYIMVRKWGPFEAAREGLRLTTETYRLDDGTHVPVYTSDAGEFLPAVTIDPKQMTVEDVENLRQHGLDEAGVTTLKEAVRLAKLARTIAGCNPVTARMHQLASFFN